MKSSMVKLPSGCESGLVTLSDDFADHAKASLNDCLGREPLNALNLQSVPASSTRSCAAGGPPLLSFAASLASPPLVNLDLELPSQPPDSQ